MALQKSTRDEIVESADTLFYHGTLNIRPSQILLTKLKYLVEISIITSNQKTKFWKLSLNCV